MLFNVVFGLRQARPRRYAADFCITLLAGGWAEGHPGGEALGTYWVHKAVLTSHSSFFETLMTTSVGRAAADVADDGGVVRGESAALRLSDFVLPAGEFDVATFETVLRFCYGTPADSLVDEGNAVKLLCVADALMLDELKQLCETKIEHMYLDAENAGVLLQLCRCAPSLAPRLERACKMLLA